MNQTAHSYRIATVVVLVIIVMIGIFFAYRNAGEGTGISGTPSSTFQVATSSTGTVITGGATVTEDASTIDIPDFRAAIKFGADVTPDVRAAVQKAADTLAARLSKNSFDLESWIQLGTVRKMGGDYKGAEAAWIFVTKASSRDPIAYSDLGDLYMNFTKEYPKAETNYLKVISVDTTNINAYISLASLYTNFYKKGTGAAEAILKKGITANPDSVDLQVTLARYYKAAGRVSDAKAEYDVAIATATRLKQADVAAQLKTEAGE